ncbi:MAG: glucose-6-phosphate dehydrogenase, partial [Actinomycetota bacterium]|nr:glucose-6-phosphate dehydrogenase [Actinomycetota bacterium]
TDSPNAAFDVTGMRPGPGLTPQQLTVTTGLADPNLESDAMDAYERLLLDVMRGDQTLFARADEVDRLWQICAPVLDNPPPALSYERCSWGPEPALALPGPAGWRLADD